ncbi:MAG: hypothetical protein AB7E49_01415 [Campylobacterales bacterium]
MNTLGSANYKKLISLLVLRAAMYSGHRRIEAAAFHRLVYFVNALAPIQKIESETKQVAKADYGLFLPDYQRALDVLVGAGLVSIGDVAYGLKNGLFLGNYWISDDGLALAAEVESANHYFDNLALAINEIISALISLGVHNNNDAHRYDANFGQETIVSGKIVDFDQERAENFSIDAARFLLDEWLKKRVSLGEYREQLEGTAIKLYSNYLRYATEVING